MKTKKFLKVCKAVIEAQCLRRKHDQLSHLIKTLQAYIDLDVPAGSFGQKDYQKALTFINQTLFIFPGISKSSFIQPFLDEVWVKRLVLDNKLTPIHDKRGAASQDAWDCEDCQDPVGGVCFDDCPGAERG